MTPDEQAVRDFPKKWMQATMDGDIDGVLDLMADDVLFLVPGREPFGKDAFSAVHENEMKDVRFDGEVEVKELEVVGDRAWLRARITVTMTPPGGEPTRRSGYTLTVLRKRPDGKWVIARDANLLPPPT